MDFAALPPEVNSARMYSGPGSAPLLAAASAWDALAVELANMGTAYETAISELGDSWTGPSSARMAEAAAPYAAWLQQTAAAAEQTALSAKSAAAAYESAFAMTVPPPAVTANRTLAATLRATNAFGHNTAKIAAADAQYAQMWAQDATAMYDYAAAAAAAARLTPFAKAPQTARSDALARQAGSAGAAGGQAGASHIGEFMTAIQQALGSMLNPGSGSGLFSGSSAALSPAMAASLAGLTADLFGTFVIDSAGTFGFDVIGTFGIDMIGVGEIGSELLPELAFVNTVSPVSAGLGQAAKVSGLSVPQAWTVGAPTVIQQTTVLPVAGATALPAAGAAAGALPAAAMATAGLAGRGAAALGRTGGRTLTQAGAATLARVRAAAASGGGTATGTGPVVGGRPAGTRDDEPAKPAARPLSGPITRIAGELRELAELRDAGILTDDEFQQEKRRLLGR